MTGPLRATGLGIPTISAFDGLDSLRPLDAAAPDPRALERSKLLALNFRALSVWETSVEERVAEEQDQAGGLIVRAVAWTESLFRSDGKTFLDELDEKIKIERALIVELRGRLAAGTSSNLHDALKILTDDPDSIFKDRARELLRQGGSHDYDGGLFLGHLIAYTAKLEHPARDGSLYGNLESTLLHDADQLTIRQQARNAAAGIFALVRQQSTRVENLAEAAKGLRALEEGKGVASLAWDLIRSSGTDDLLQIAMMGAASKAGGLARFAANRKAEAWGLRGLQAMALRQGAEIGAEGSALWAMGIAKDSLNHNLGRIFSPQNLSKSWLSNLGTVAGMRLFGLAGQGLAGVLFPALAKKTGWNFSSPIWAFSLRHSLGFGGMFATNQLSQALDLRERPKGGLVESALEDAATYVKFGLGRRAMENLGRRRELPEKVVEAAPKPPSAALEVLEGAGWERQGAESFLREIEGQPITSRERAIEGLPRLLEWFKAGRWSPLDQQVFLAKLLKRHRGNFERLMEPLSNALQAMGPSWEPALQGRLLEKIGDQVFLRAMESYRRIPDALNWLSQSGMTVEMEQALLVEAPEILWNANARGSFFRLFHGELPAMPRELIVTTLHELVNRGWSIEKSLRIFERLQLSQGQSLEKAVAALPKLADLLGAREWSSDKQVQLLEHLASRLGKYSALAVESLPQALAALDPVQWSPLAQFMFLDSLSEHCREGTGNAYARLPLVLQDLSKAGISREEQQKFLVSLAENTGIQMGRAYSFLPQARATVEAMGFSPEEQMAFLGHIPRRAENVDYALINLSHAWESTKVEAWSLEARRIFFAQLTATAQSNLDVLYQSLPDIMEAMDRSAWQPESRSSFLLWIASKAQNESAPVFEGLSETLRALESLAWSAEAQEQALRSLPANHGGLIAHLYKSFPTALLSLKGSGWSAARQSSFLIHLNGAAKSWGAAALGLTGYFASRAASPSRAALAFSDVVLRLDDSNRKGVLSLLQSQRFSMRHLYPPEINDRLDLFAEVFRRWPREGLNIMEGLYEGWEQKALKPNIRDERESILAFVEKLRDFSPALYLQYKVEGDSMIEAIESYRGLILEDRLDLAAAQGIVERQGIDFLLAVIHSASPIRGDTPREEHLKLLQNTMALGDLRGHVPEPWRDLLVSSKLHQGRWVLKNGESLDSEGRIAKIIGLLREGELGAPIDSERFRNLLGKYLEVPRTTEGVELVREKLYQLAAQEESIRQQIDRIDGEGCRGLLYLEQLFNDKDQIPSILGTVIDRLPPESFDAKGLRLPIGGEAERLAKHLRSIWNKLGPSERRQEILQNILGAYRSEDVESKLLSRPEFAPDLRSAIVESLKVQPQLTKQQLIREILDEPQRHIRLEREKFVYNRDAEMNLGLRAVKGPAFALAGLTAGICTAFDLKLLQKPEFKWMLIEDQGQRKAVGYANLLEGQVDGSPALFVPGINPTEEFMSMVNAREIHEVLERGLIEFADIGGYNGVYLPISSIEAPESPPVKILSNRPDYRKSILAKGYPTRRIPSQSWNSLPKPFPFDEVLVLWERK